jgi:hypothetical protein
LNDIYHALARTALLIEVDIFPGMDHRVIIDGLRVTTARIISDGANIASPAGQAALATLYALLAMLGLQIDLDVPAAGLAADQPRCAAATCLRACWITQPICCPADQRSRPGSRT